MLAFTALLPLINPIGSALIFLGLVGDEPAQVYHQLARKIAMATFFFLVVIEFLGSLLLSFFGISLPIIQLTGGLVIGREIPKKFNSNEPRNSMTTRKTKVAIAIRRASE